jgi:large subunit ribosomal protein L3
MRTGLIAKKLGMTQIFLDSGVQVPVTVLKVEPCTVIEQKTNDKHGYSAVKLGTGEIAARKLNKAQREDFAKKQIEPSRILKEFRVDEADLLDIGTRIGADHFSEGQYIDATGISVGKGFAGGMKRHNFGGLRASHGVSVSHRSHGSTGNRQDPGKVFKNKKMAGHMGARKVTKLNLLVQSIDAEQGLIFVKGSIPGHKDSVVFIRDAIKKTARKAG